MSGEAPDTPLNNILTELAMQSETNYIARDMSDVPPLIAIDIHGQMVSNN
jgi:hypothetical protein